jgi:hypothetical protein
MPRHPPCALHSLPNKHSTKTTTPQTPHRECGIIKLQNILQRHTLQKTNTHTKQPPPNTDNQAREGTCAGDARVHYPDIKPPGDNPPPHPNRDAGARFLRAQQCAKHPPTRHQPQVPHPPAPKKRGPAGSTERPAPTRARGSSMIPLVRHHPPPTRTARGPRLLVGEGVCSLERR